MRAEEEEAQLTVAHMLIAIVGVGYLFPFSALTQPVDFWNLAFPDFNIEFPLTTVFMWVDLVCVFLIVFFAGKNPSYEFRIVGGFIGQAAVLLLVPTLYYFHLSEHTYFLATMACTALAAIATAVVDSVAIGFAAHYPVVVQQGLQLGIGLSTLIGSIYRILTKLVFPADQVVLSSLIYFYVGVFTILACIFVYYRLVAMDISAKYIPCKRTVSSPQPCKPPPSYGALHTDVELAHRPLPTVSSSETIALLPASPPASSSPLCTKDTDTALPLDQWTLLAQVFFNEMLVFACYFTTLLLWPAFVTEIPCHTFPAWQANHWWSLGLLFLFAVLDCLGRMLTSYRMGLTSQNVHLAVLARLALIPWLLLCAKGPAAWQSDGWALVGVGALGFSNGYVGSLTVMMVTEMVPEGYRGQVGSFTGFFLNFGLVIGCTLAGPLKMWLEAW